MKMPLSPSSSSPSTSQVLQLSPTTPENPSRRSSNLLTGACFFCKQPGHWIRSCPLKSPNNTTPLSLSPKLDSPVSPNTNIPCHCGHGFCEVKTSKTDKNKNRKYYACPIKRGARCGKGGFVKWCDEPVNESDFKPPSFTYPECDCGAGVCRRVKCTESPNLDKYYFTCPVKKDHGSCGYLVSEDKLLDLLNSQNIVPVRQSGRRRTLKDFWEGCQNDGADNDLGKGDDMLVQTKRMRIMDCPKNSSSIAVSEIPEEEDAGAAVQAARSKDHGFLEFEVADDDLEFTNSVPWDTIEAEAFLLTSLSTHSRIRWRQSCPMGWLGRLLFFYPTQSLEFPKPKPFFCCVFPSFNRIVVRKQKRIPDDPCERNQLAIDSVSQNSQLSTSCHTEVSKDVVSPKKSKDSERKPISKAQRHNRDVALFTQQRLLIDLETWDALENESMREAAMTTFALLNILGVDCKQFSDHVLDYINFVSSIAEIDKSTETFLTMEEHNKLMEEEKMRLAQLQDDYVKTEALLEASNQHRQKLTDEVSNLKAMLHEKENQLKSCELETLKIETCLGDLETSMLEADVTLKGRVEQTEVIRKQNEGRQTKQIAAKAALEKAKLELEN